MTSSSHIVLTYGCYGVQSTIQFDHSIALIGRMASFQALLQTPFATILLLFIQVMGNNCKWC